MRGSRGGGGIGGPNPLINHKNIGFLRNTGPDPLKNHKATKPAFHVGPSSERRWPAYRVFGSSLLPSSTNKTLSELDPLWQNFLEDNRVVMDEVA